MTRYSIAETITSPARITPEFAAAFDMLEHGKKNIFLTGKAGTGKSTFLHYFRSNTEKNIAVVAPTGVAALNVGGQTIHSFLRIKPGFINKLEIKPNRNKIYRELELLIIDEISMVRSDLFDGIDHFLRLARKNNQPFGGVQICAIGDLYQLPPIVTNDEQEFFAQHYASPFFFATDAYRDGKFETIQFETVHRQNDAEFVHILNAIRADACDSKTLAALNARVIPKASPAKGTLVLTTTNQLAESINDTQLERIAGTPRVYEGELKGNFVVSGGRLPAAESLALKIGAQVMFVKNDPDGCWVNGTVGIVETMEDESITVSIAGVPYDVPREKWKTIAYEFSETEGKIVEKTVGSYSQFPLQLAWAITIHKSQGKTLERVIIDLGRGAFAPGQLYVALSRCRTLSGIALKQPVTPRDIRCDAEVVAFTNG